MTYLIMFFEFFKIGLFSVGGGLATLPFLFEMAEKYSWLITEELTNMIAVSESTPGPIGVNIATYVGYTAGGVGAGIMATLSLILPSIIVILIVSAILEKFKENKLVKNLFYGLRAAVVGLLFLSVLTIFGQNFLTGEMGGLIGMVDFRKVLLFAVLLFMVFKLKKHPLLYLVIGAAVGILWGF